MIHHQQISPDQFSGPVGEGFISLGVPVKNQQPEAVIRFRCKPVQLKLDEA